MKIYKYMSIDALESIFKNRTIRFSRLDKVDDPEEYAASINGFAPSAYAYVSCWTKNDKEIIPMWDLYGDKRHGVRIAVDDLNLFQFNTECLYPEWPKIKEPQGTGLIVNHILPHERYYYGVEYINSPRNFDDNKFTIFNGKIGMNRNQVGRYKGKVWEFQEEVRFMLWAYPKNTEGSADFPRNEDKKDFDKYGYVDVPVRLDVFKDIEITIGPDATEEERKRIRQICERYLDGFELKESSFMDMGK